MMTNLKAYCFSEQELQKMLELKTLFQVKGFEIDIFPKVYYDNYEKYKEIFGEIDFDKEDIPDCFGVYLFGIEDDKINTKEGIVVLFKDKIEAYAKYLSEVKNNGLSISENINTIKLLVLIHELGHWLCHWPLAEGENWKKGYGLKNIKTHESLAQLITFWMVENHKDLKVFFETHLVPKDDKNEYALFKKIKNKSKNEILENLIFLRKHYSFFDELNFFILLNDRKSIKDKLFWNQLLNELNDSFYLRVSFNQTDKDYISNIFKEFKSTDFDQVIHYKKQKNMYNFLFLLNDLYSKEDCPFFELKNYVIGRKYGW